MAFLAPLATIPWGQLGKMVAQNLPTALKLSEETRRWHDSLREKKARSGQQFSKEDIAVVQLSARVSDLEESDLTQADLLSQQGELISQQAAAIDQLSLQNQGLLDAVRVLEARTKLLGWALGIFLVLAIAAIAVAFFL